MKKFLLSLTVLLATLSASADELVEGEYFKTNSARFKVVELYNVPTISEWNNYSAEFFSVYTAQADDDQNGYQSTNSDATSFVSTAIELEPDAEYVVRFCYYYTEAGASSITDEALNQFDAWTSAQDDFGSRTGTAGTDYIQVASTFNYGANAWTEVSWSFTNTLPAGTDEAPDPWQGSSFLNILFSRVNTGAIVTDVQVAKVEKVYDTRRLTKEIDWIKTLLADSNFNTDAVKSSDDYSTLTGAMNDLEVAIEEDSEEFDSEESGEQMESELLATADAVLSIEAPSLNDKLQYIDFTTYDVKFDKANNYTFGAFKVDGGRWHHEKKDEIVYCSIQKTQPFGEHKMTVSNQSFPAGKYFFEGEVRYSNCPSNAWTWTYETEGVGGKAYIGENVYDLQTLPASEEWTRFYYIGDITDGNTFNAGFIFPAMEKADNTRGTCWQVRKLSVRGFGDKAMEIAYKEAWTSFITQWNAAKNARTNMIAKGEDNNYPWSNDTINKTLNEWDPIYNKFAGVWVDEEGNDIYKSKAADLQTYIDELNAFGDGTDQGYTPTAEEVEAESWKTKFALVRAYQYGNDYIANTNKPIFDLKAAINDAIATRDDAMNVSGDKATYQIAINAAQNVYDDIIANTTDERKDADIENINTQIQKLADAKTVFLESAKIPDVVNIDFSNGFTPVTDPEDESIITTYFIQGNPGQMYFNNASSVNTNNNEEGTVYQLGYQGDKEDILHVGASEATVDFSDAAPTDDDVIRVEFDIYFAKLTTKYTWIDLRNADGATMAGFKYDLYENKLAYNHFNNASGKSNDTGEIWGGGTGLDICNTRYNIGNSNNIANITEANRSHFTLILDYKAESLIGSMTANGKTCNGQAVPMLNVAFDTSIEDNKVVKFVLGSDYNNAGRRCWFDNLVIKKYPSSAEGSAWTIIDAPTSSTTASSVPVAYYTISGVQTTADQKGIVIVKYADGTTKKIFNK